MIKEEPPISFYDTFDLWGNDPCVLFSEFLLLRLAIGLLLIKIKRFFVGIVILDWVHLNKFWIHIHSAFVGYDITDFIFYANITFSVTKIK